MSGILAKFALESVDAYYEAGHDGEIDYLRGANVTFTAVKGEPFGPATPFGRVQMTILNPAAARAIVEPWGVYVRQINAQSKAGRPLHEIVRPEYFVHFEPDMERGHPHLTPAT